MTGDSTYDMGVPLTAPIMAARAGRRPYCMVDGMVRSCGEVQRCRAFGGVASKRRWDGEESEGMESRTRSQRQTAADEAFIQEPLHDRRTTNCSQEIGDLIRVDLTR